MEQQQQTPYSVLLLPTQNATMHVIFGWLPSKRRYQASPTVSVNDIYLGFQVLPRTAISGRSRQLTHILRCFGSFQLIILTTPTPPPPRSQRPLFIQWPSFPGRPGFFLQTQSLLLLLRCRSLILSWEKPNPPTNPNPGSRWGVEVGARVEDGTPQTLAVLRE